MRKMTIARDDAGQRTDRFLRKVLASSPLGNVFKLMRTGVIRVNGKKAKPDTRLAEGDVVEIRLAEASVAALSATGASASAAAPPPSRPATPLAILHRDEHVLAVDKPPFVLVQRGDDAHASPRDPPPLDEQVRDFAGPQASHTFRPGLAHRLDRGTSGIVLFGLSAEGLRGLTEAFRNRRVDKRYIALVAGEPPEDAFTVDLPLARDPSDETRGSRMKVSRGADALSALTEFRVLARSADAGFALVEARPKTGRTHQIRAHLRAVRLPIVGDPTYGDPRRNPAWAKRPGIRRQFLHAARVSLAHPVLAGRELRVESPLAPDLVRTLRFAGIDAGDLDLPRAP